MFNDMFNDYNCGKSYKTIANLETALTKAGLDKCRPLLVQIPTGKNAGRFTAIFPWMDGRNNAIIFMGFKVMG
jgi:hypothetical protein